MPMIAEKMVLINSKTSKNYRAVRVPFKEFAPNSTLALLACETETRLQKARLPIPQITVYDRPEITDSLILECAQADLVGFSTWFTNYSEAVRTAQAIKAKNPLAKIVFGGHEVSNLSRMCPSSNKKYPSELHPVLKNQSSVDYVVSGDGEDSLWRLAAGLHAKEIPNLWYRNPCGESVFSYRKEVDLDDIGFFDYRHFSNLDLSAYDSRQTDYRKNFLREPLTLSWTRGCHRAAERGKRCAYCSVSGSRVRLTSPARAWQQVWHLYHNYGAETYFESGDDFSLFEYVKKLSEHPDRFPGLRLRCYSSFNDLNSEKVAAFKKLGVYEIYFGLDNTDPIINAWSGHDLLEKQVFSAMSLIEKSGIQAILAIMFGMPGETHDSLLRAEKLVEELVVSFSNIRMVVLSRAVPLAGSQWYQQLIDNPAIRSAYGEDKFLNADCPNYLRLSSLSIQYLSHVSENSIHEAMARIRKKISKKTCVGSYGALDEQWSMRCGPEE